MQFSPDTITQKDIDLIVEVGVSRGSQMSRGIVYGFARAIAIYLMHRDNPVPYLVDELKRLAKIETARR